MYFWIESKQRNKCEMENLKRKSITAGMWIVCSERFILARRVSKEVTPPPYNCQSDSSNGTKEMPLNLTEIRNLLRVIQ